MITCGALLATALTSDIVRFFELHMKIAPSGHMAKKRNHHGCEEGLFCSHFREDGCDAQLFLVDAVADASPATAAQVLMEQLEYEGAPIHLEPKIDFVTRKKAERKSKGEVIFHPPEIMLTQCQMSAH